MEPEGAANWLLRLIPAAATRLGMVMVVRILRRWRRAKSEAFAPSR
jgi:cytochrome c-type biogenesis protein CcmH/NrfF